MKCYLCNEEVKKDTEVPTTPYVALNYMYGELIHKELFFHSKCFFNVAGSHYEEELQHLTAYEREKAIERALNPVIKTTAAAQAQPADSLWCTQCGHYRALPGGLCWKCDLYYNKRRIK